MGAAKLEGGLTLDYAGIEGFRIAGRGGLALIVACQAALMGGPEYARYVGIESLQPVGVFLPGSQAYPGGAPFDPLGFSRDAEAFLDQQVRCHDHPQRSDSSVDKVRRRCAQKRRGGAERDDQCLQRTAIANARHE